MHGRLKVKTTEQQNEEKKKKRQEKLVKYNKAKMMIFDKRSRGELDEELLSLTEAVLYAQPDIYTMWNIRKSVFIELAKTLPAEDVGALHRKELEFLVVCLKTQPKSYCCWHQRIWMMSQMLKPDWRHELELCNQFLEYDERNFHCWDYRRFVAQRTEVSYEEELAFTLGKISTNFSNYSSWHYRSKLLPLVSPAENHSWTGMNEETLLNEFELVQNAIFTDPNDQSAWFYHRWLLGRDELPTTVRCVHAKLNTKCVYIMFTKPINVIDEGVEVQCNGCQLELTPCGPYQFTRHSILWMGKLPEEQSELNILVKHSDTLSCELQMCSEHSTAVYENETLTGKMSSGKRAALELELDNCKQLVDMEKDNKWAGLSLVLLLLMVDAEQNHEAAVRILRGLAVLDPYRTKYYSDQYSEILVASKLFYNNTPHTHSLDLSCKNLTALYHTEHMLNVTCLDISNNNLTNINSLWMLQLLDSLIADSNSISDLSVIEQLPCLTLLSIKHNLVSSLEVVVNAVSLKTLRIAGNPVCVEGQSHNMTTLLPHVDIDIS